MIGQTQQQAKDTRKLKHFTRKYHLSSISKHGLQLEGWNAEQAVMNWPYPQKLVHDQDDISLKIEPQGVPYEA